jgi:hypothetical protein
MGIIFLVENFAKFISSKLFIERPGKPTQQFETIFTKASTKSSQGDKLKLGGYSSYIYWS